MPESPQAAREALLQRRELLKKLRRRSLDYTAPSVLLLLASDNSFGHNNPVASYVNHEACVSAAEHATMGMGMGMSADNHCSMKHGI